MMDATSRLSLPLLAAGQAQKELAHNEALTLIDMLVQPVVETVGDDAPPTTPVPGQSWIVGVAPTGDWAGQGGAIAEWTEGGWRFVAARDGMCAWVAASGLWAQRIAGVWQLGRVAAASIEVGGVQVVGAQRPAIMDPSGGTAIDAEARSAISAVLQALRAHGLIAQ